MLGLLVVRLMACCSHEVTGEIDFDERVTAVTKPEPNVYRLVAVMDPDEIRRAGRSPLFLQVLAILTAFLQVHFPLYLLSQQLSTFDMVGLKTPHFLLSRWEKVISTVPAMFTVGVVFIKGTQSRLSEELVKDYFLLTLRDDELRGEGPSSTTVPNLSINSPFAATEPAASPLLEGRNYWGRSPAWRSFWCCLSALVQQWSGLNMIAVMMLCIATASGDYTDFVLHVMGNFFVYSIPDLIANGFPILTQLYAAEFQRQRTRKRNRNTVWESFKPLHTAVTQICDITIFFGLWGVFITYWVVKDTGEHVGPFIEHSHAVTFMRVYRGLNP
eukprot:Hpha_TRINITY_DN3060_c0_g1::TRINITY_DN3060_c0_g1_i1::g.138738::m.138738